MTLKELDTHFGLYPDEIIYYDKTDNIQETIPVCHFRNGRVVFEGNAYDEFIKEFGEKQVDSWTFGYGYVLELELR